MIDVAAVATGRDQSLFAADVDASSERIAAVLSDRRVLVVGGAGSIGSATVRAILRYDPRAVHVVDQNENDLAELVRDLRGSGLVQKRLELKLMPLDYGASVCHRFLRSTKSYDVVFHFAALKHVRSEKDVASILQMIDTNVLKQRRLMGWLAEEDPPGQYFAVSTDKAANPANFMGASKRLMERVIFAGESNPLRHSIRTSARFANVAFSAGSLLASFPERIRRRQPIAVPGDTRRFFVSVEEAAEICLLACAAVPTEHVAIPRLDPDQNLRQLSLIAEAFLEARALRAVYYEDETSAREAVERDAARGCWPLLKTPRDTPGEKESEVFAGDQEVPVDVGLSALLAIPQSPADSMVLDGVLAELQELVDDPRTSIVKPELAAIIRRVVGEFHPLAGEQGLDDRL